MPQSIIITGASGFLGTAVLRELKSRDNKNIKIIPVSRRPVEGGIIVSDYSETPCGDILIHLAEERDRALVETMGEEYIQKTGATLTALISKKYNRIIYASSATLYGDAIPAPHRPEDPVYATDIYNKAKSEGEKAVLETRIGIIARLANLYGPGMAQNNVISTIIDQARQTTDNPLKVRDDTPIRDFLWISDAARALASMATEPVIAKTEQAIYNVGSGIGISVREMARLALKISGQPMRSVIAEKSSDRQSTIVLDISSTRIDWKWEPSVDMASGLSALLTN
ncbi:MAG: NAD(P)-dependent oxidoreductase, partial [Alphaproteobacteria bacterium]|nr:NAD(P)-dependent oxidoreductase [Alphaproteobacteria bacterium]